MNTGPGANGSRGGVCGGGGHEKKHERQQEQQQLPKEEHAHTHWKGVREHYGAPDEQNANPRLRQPVRSLQKECTLQVGQHTHALLAPRHRMCTWKRGI